MTFVTVGEPVVEAAVIGPYILITPLPPLPAVWLLESTLPPPPPPPVFETPDPAEYQLFPPKS